MSDNEPTAGAAVQLPESVASFLVELARALQRFGMYPAGHPAREKTAETVCERFAGMVEGTGDVQLEIAPDRVVVGDVASDPGQTVIAGMASRLYQHQLQKVTFRPGLQPRELANLLATVSVAVGTTGKPLGSEPAEQLNRWPHVRIEPIPFEQLAFSTQQAASGSAVGRGTGEQEGMSGAAAAAAEKVAGVDSAQKVMPPSPEQESVRRKIARLILKLDTDSLRGLVRKIEQSRPADGSQDEVAAAVAELLQAAESGRLAEPSEALLKLVTKMGIHGGDAAEREGAAGAGDSPGIGEVIKQLGGDWNLDDPTPQEYKEALVGLSRSAPILGTKPVFVERPEPDRMLKLAVELDDSGPLVEAAVNDMLQEGRAGDVIAMLDEAPEGVQHIGEFWDMVAQPETVLHLLRLEPPDFETLDRLMPRLKPAAAEPMIEMLGEVESGARAREITERIVRLGPGVRPYAVNWLVDERWHVRRNMLALLSHFDDLPEDFTPAPYLVDPDPRVRREAMHLGLAAWTEIEAVIVAALEDSDPQIVEMGIDAAKKECPPAVVPYLEAHALDEKAASPLRVGAIQALASSGSPRALPTLLKIAWVRKIFWIKGLADKSSELLAALAALSEQWAQDHTAARVLRGAHKSKDPQIRAVVRKSGGEA